MNKIANYFTKFDQQVKRTIRRDSTFGSLYNALKTNKIKLTEKYDYSEIKNKLDEFSRVLDKVISIIYRPHIEVSTSDIVLRSELAGNLSRDSFFDTTRDTKLWKRKNGEFSPEYVHTKENVDTIVNYENRFIAMLVSEIDDEFEILRNSIEFVNDSIEEKFETKSIGYGEHSIFNEFKEFSFPYEGIFVKPSSKVTAINKLIIKINRRLKNIKATEFFELNNEKKINDAIIPTNVLMHDQKYNYCYKYYRNNYLFVHEDNFSYESHFYNYMIVSLFSYLAHSRVGYSKKNMLSKVYFDENGELHFNPIKFKKGVFSYLIKEYGNDRGVIIKTQYVEKVISKKRKSFKDDANYYLLPIFTLNEDSYKNIDHKILKLSKDYENVISITGANIIHDYNYVLTLSIFKENHNVLFKNLFASLNMLFIVDTDEYKYKCPICGSKNVYQNNMEYGCEICNANFSFVHFDNQEALWIKSFRRKY